jgi:hypothetical protein
VKFLKIYLKLAGTKKNGQWHGPANFTSQDGEVKDERWDNGRKI